MTGLSFKGILHDKNRITDIIICHIITPWMPVKKAVNVFITSCFSNNRFLRKNHTFEVFLSFVLMLHILLILTPDVPT